MISEGLINNSTLTSLDLGCAENNNTIFERNNKQLYIGDCIDDEGARKIGDVLKVNSTLTKLSLERSDKLMTRNKKKTKNVNTQ